MTSILSGKGSLTEVTPPDAAFAPDRTFSRLMNGLSNALMKRRSLRYETLFAVTAIAVATFLRAAIDDILPPGFPFLTFFPAVMLTLVFASIRAGVIVAIICGIISWYWFIVPFGAFSLTDGALLAISFYTLITATDVLFVTAAGWALRAMYAARAQAAKHAEARSLMFSELQHRVSNNLGTIAALLRLQAAQTQDPEARRALSASQSRINLISRLQRRLHAPDLQALEAGEYLKSVLDDTIEVASEGKPVTLEFHSDVLHIDTDAAIPLGLIVSELAMNAIEHAHPEGQRTVIRVQLQTKPEPEDDTQAATLTLIDNGSGLPDGFSLEQTDSLGLTIAEQFAAILNGEMNLSSGPDGGTIARLHFRVKRAEPVMTDQGDPLPLSSAFS